MYFFVKRLLDLFLCMLSLPFLCVIWIIVAIFIKLEDGGPVFYFAERIGKDCKKFYMYKFRSMKVNAPNIMNNDGSTYNAEDDPRVTKVGKFIRETSIDELPQIINVIKGEMSLIGPRAREWESLDSYLPDEMDLFLCMLSLPFLCVIWIIVAIFIKLEDGGPVFYFAERIGKDCKKFYMYKFRSMKVNAPNIMNNDGSTYNAEDDPRVTKVGKFIRETSIDELPQIINVIKGEMSLIGPRASEWESLDSYLPDEMDKLKMLPGITGYTQAYYRNSITPRQKRLYDS